MLIHQYLFTLVILFNAMEILIDKKVDNLITTFTENYKEDNNFKKLLEANELYNELIKEGKMKKRGYTLASATEIYAKTVVLNQSNLSI